jgi:hypothetical protein
MATAKKQTESLSTEEQESEDFQEGVQEGTFDLRSGVERERDRMREILYGVKKG